MDRAQKCTSIFVNVLGLQLTEMIKGKVEHKVLTFFFNHVIGAKYPPALPMTNLRQQIWLTTYSGVSPPNHIFPSTRRPCLRDLSLVHSDQCNLNCHQSIELK